MEVFPERLKSLRGDATQTAFARRIGVAQNSYSRYESGERVPDIKVLAQIARTLGVSADWLLGIGGSATAPPADAAGQNIPDGITGRTGEIACADMKDATIAKQAESILVQAKSVSTQADALSNQSQALVNNSQVMVNHSDSIKSLAKTLEASVGVKAKADTL
jgi:transcriptional regulator with XRE-family HTH domain